MARVPLQACLLADPELSLQSILVHNGIKGEKKTVLYVALVAVMSNLAGFLFGIALTSYPPTKPIVSWAKVYIHDEKVFN